MLFKKSKEMKVAVLHEQEKQLSSKDKIKKECQKEDVLAFDIYCDNLLIGFIMVQNFDKGAYFLWNYAIDYKYQNQNYGTTALIEFIDFMKNTYQMSKMTTTYICGNKHAKHLYEKLDLLKQMLLMMKIAMK